MSRELVGRWERVLYVLILALALFSRFYMLGDRAISHDESIHTKFSWNLSVGNGFQHNPMMHGPLLFEATALVYWLFGPNDFTSRIFEAAAGVVLVMTPFLFRRWLGRSGALVASVLLLISPSISYYSRYIRHDVLLMLTAVLLLWVMLQFLESGRKVWLAWLAAFFSLMFATKEAAYIYTAIFGALLFLPFAWKVMTVKWERGVLYTVFVGLLFLGLLMGLAFAISFREGQVSQLALDDAGNSSVTSTAIPLWGRIAAIGALSAFAVALIVMRIGIGDHELRQIRLFDLLMVLGTLTLPLGSAFLIKFTAGVDMTLVYNAVRTGDFSSIPGRSIVIMSVVIAVTLLVSIIFGLMWDRKRWPVVALIHYSIFLVLYTTVFSWAFGALSGLVGGLAYWLAQQGVKRGDQPMYYYLLVGPLYEYLAITLSLGSGVAALVQAVRGLSHRLRPPDQAAEDARPNGGLDLSHLFPLFLLGWTALSWIAYTLAGEKMPWLLVHIALPSIFLAGWGAGRLLDGVPWAGLKIRPAASFAVALPLALGSLVVFVRNVLGLRAGLQQGVSPAGLDLAQLGSIGYVLGGLAGLIVFGVLLYRSLAHLGGRTSLRLATILGVLVMATLTVRTMVMLDYINDDLATELLVYAHGTPDIKVALQQVRDVSWTQTGTANDVRVAYGEDGSWPFTWYMTQFPNNYFYAMAPDPIQLKDCPVIIAGSPQYDAVESIIGDDYVTFDYRYLWWPIQDYFGLTWGRIRTALTDPQMRAALWDIVWRRDYARYAELKNPVAPFDLFSWPYRKDFRLYVRRDVAEATWPISRPAGVARYVQPVETPPPDPFAAGARNLPLVSQVLLPGSVVRGIAQAADGTFYVADTLNHRIWHIGPDGPIDSFGGYGTDVGQFNEPWDVAVGPDGSIYVADTWNHRVQKFDPSYVPLASWGGIVQVTQIGAPGAQGLFYGPRGIAVSPEGDVFVADTGNKRVQVFDADGNFLREFGGWGTGPGQLDEPVGIAISPEGTVAVADTWNLRVQLFDEQGVPLTQWDIPTWVTDNPDEKPFLTWGTLTPGTADTGSPVGLFVTDSLGHRVLAFDATGAFQWGLSAAAGAKVAFPQGLLVADGILYVADAQNGDVAGFALP